MATKFFSEIILQLALFVCINCSDTHSSSPTLGMLTSGSPVTVQFLWNTDCVQKDSTFPSHSTHFPSAFLYNCIGSKAACIMLHQTYKTITKVIQDIFNMTLEDSSKAELFNPFYVNLLEVHLTLLGKQRLSPAQLVLVPEEQCECSFGLLTDKCVPQFGKRSFNDSIQMPHMILLFLENITTQIWSLRIPRFAISSILLIVNNPFTNTESPILAQLGIDSQTFNHIISPLPTQPLEVPPEIHNFYTLTHFWLTHCITMRGQQQNIKTPVAFSKNQDLFFSNTTTGLVVAGEYEYLILRNFLPYRNFTCKLCMELFQKVAQIEFGMIYAKSDRFLFRVPYGIKNVHYEYKVFVKPPADNWMSILEPFPLKGWLLVLGTVAGLAILVKLFNSDQSPSVVFWILVGGGNDSWEKEGHIRLTVILTTWVFVAIIIREAYLSTMYSYLTNEPKILGVPKSLLEIANEKKVMSMIPVICSQEFLTHLNTLVSNVEDIEKFRMKDMAKIYKFIYVDTWTLRLSGNADGMKKFLDNIKNNKPVPILRIQKPKSRFKNVLFDSFAFIYANRRSSTEQTFLREIKSRKGVKNKDSNSALAEAPNVWSVSEHSVIFKIFNDFIGKFDQSGIYQRDRLWLEVLRTLMKDRKAQRKGSKEIGINMFAFYFQNNVMLDQARKFLEKKEPVSVETFMVLWVMLGVMTVVGSIIFVWELTLRIRSVSKISVNGHHNGYLK